MVESVYVGDELLSEPISRRVPIAFIKRIDLKLILQGISAIIFGANHARYLVGLVSQHVLDRRSLTSSCPYKDAYFGP